MKFFKSSVRNNETRLSLGRVYVCLHMVLRSRFADRYLTSKRVPMHTNTFVYIRGTKALTKTKTKKMKTLTHLHLHTFTRPSIHLQIANARAGWQSFVGK